MKSKLLMSSAISLIAMTVVLMFSCSDDVQRENQEVSAELNSGIFEKPTLFGDNVYLPEGTYWHYANEQKNEVVFELPKEYVFLLKNSETDEYDLSTKIASYSCRCTGEEGSCATFYNESLGYGCLQSSCSGGCIGSGNIDERLKTGNYQIAGVLLAENDDFDANLTEKKRASLRSGDVKGFLELQKVQEKIQETYDFFYKFPFEEKMPDFDSEIYDPDKFSLLKGVIYGVELGLIVPSNVVEYLQDLFPDDNSLKVSRLLSSDTPSGCACSGGSQGGNCKLEKLGGGVLGKKYTVYYCTGCTTCTME